MNDQIRWVPRHEVTTDFRVVLANIAERHLRLGDRQLAQVFPSLPAMPSSLRLLRA